MTHEQPAADGAWSRLVSLCATPTPKEAVQTIELLAVIRGTLTVSPKAWDTVTQLTREELLLRPPVTNVQDAAYCIRCLKGVAVDPTLRPEAMIAIAIHVAHRRGRFGPQDAA